MPICSEPGPLASRGVEGIQLNAPTPETSGRAPTTFTARSASSGATDSMKSPAWLSSSSLGHAVSVRRAPFAAVNAKPRTSAVIAASPTRPPRPLRATARRPPAHRSSAYGVHPVGIVALR